MASRRQPSLPLSRITVAGSGMERQRHPSLALALLLEAHVARAVRAVTSALFAEEARRPLTGGSEEDVWRIAICWALAPEDKRTP